jgi:hypothetical protein
MAVALFLNPFLGQKLVARFRRGLGLRKQMATIMGI